MFTVARQGGNLVRVKDVPRGLDCGCDCPECRQPFVKVLRMGTEFFRHHTRNRAGEVVRTCGATEARLLEWYATQEIAKHLGEIMPGYTLFDQHKGEDVGYTGSNYRADLVLESEQETVYIEVVVTHRMSAAKRTWLAEEFDERGSSVWNIDLSRYRAVIEAQGEITRKMIEDNVHRIPSRRYLRLEELRTRRINDVEEYARRFWRPVRGPMRDEYYWHGRHWIAKLRHSPRAGWYAVVHRKGGGWIGNRFDIDVAWLRAFEEASNKE